MSIEVSTMSTMQRQKARALLVVIARNICVLYERASVSGGSSKLAGKMALRTCDARGQHASIYRYASFLIAKVRALYGDRGGTAKPPEVSHICFFRVRL